MRSGTWPDSTAQRSDIADLWHLIAQRRRDDKSHTQALWNEHAIRSSANLRRLVTR